MRLSIPATSRSPAPWALMVLLVGSAFGPIPAEPRTGAFEIPPLSEEELRAQADMVILGTVTAVRQFEAQELDTVRTNYVLDVTIWSLEKGRPATGSRFVRAAGWQLKSAPPGWVGPSGHYTSDENGKEWRMSNLRAGSNVRLYLGERAPNGNRTILSPNGFQLLPDAEGKR